MRHSKFILLLALLLPFVAMSQNITVSGTVRDSQKNPIPGATVVLKGNAAVGTVTDGNGKYSVIVPKNGILVFSLVGFKTTEVSIKNKNVIDVVLKDSQDLSEVVITVKPELSIKEVRKHDRNDAKKEIIGKVTRNYIQDEKRQPNTEEYGIISESEFQDSKKTPLSTFSIDVDRASYSNIRRFVTGGQMPPKDAVRIEEMVNYFDYEYPDPKGNVPFSVNTETSVCPWNPQNKLVLVNLQGKKISLENIPPSNLVFLIDVSGSMSEENKLPLLKKSFYLLIDQLRPEDRVSIVVYAGAAGLVLPPTAGSEKATIKNALEKLNAGGSTAGGAGIGLAYKVATDNFIKGGNNRVILATDGDFNVGVSSDDEMVRLIEDKRKSGVFLTTLGFGMGNYKDSKMEKLADKGNGNYSYIDNLQEGKKVFINEFGGTLFTIAKDVKLQIEFNPAKVKGYRLVGYENRLLNKEDFHDDKKDAGELGSGHTVTAFYEIVPADGSSNTPILKVDGLKYQTQTNTKESQSSEFMNIKLRYKLPSEETSKLIEKAVDENVLKLDETSNNFRFASAVAEFGLLLRDSKFKAKASYPQLAERAKKAKGADLNGYRAEFIQLVETVIAMQNMSKK